MKHSISVQSVGVCAGVGLPGEGHGDDVRLQEAGEDPRKEETRRKHGPEREGAAGEAGQSLCGESDEEICFGLKTTSEGVLDVCMEIYIHLSSPLLELVNCVFGTQPDQSVISKTV